MNTVFILLKKKRLAKKVMIFYRQLPSRVYITLTLFLLKALDNFLTIPIISCQYHQMNLIEKNIFERNKAPKLNCFPFNRTVILGLKLGLLICNVNHLFEKHLFHCMHVSFSSSSGSNAESNICCKSKLRISVIISSLVDSTNSHNTSIKNIMGRQRTNVLTKPRN